MCVCARVCVCVRVCERERERQGDTERERERKTEGQRVYDLQFSANSNFLRVIALLGLFLYLHHL